jgi:hypothetical protein
MVKANGQLTVIEYDSTTGTSDLLDKPDILGVALFLDLIGAVDIPMSILRGSSTQLG